MNTSAQAVPQSELLLYQTEDGQTRIQCRFEADTLWLSQSQMAELFQVTVPNINLHLKGIYAEGELPAEATIKSYLIVRSEGGREYEKYRALLDASPRAVDADFEKTTAEMQQLRELKKPRTKNKP